MKALTTSGAFLLVIGCSLLLGCASIGNKSIQSETIQSVSEKVVKGETTRDEIRAIYGSPMSASANSDGVEVWVYLFTRSSAKATTYIPYVNLLSSGAKARSKSLTFTFDENGVVTNFNMSESEADVNTGILH